jgi:hypothetical protein
MQKLAEPYCVKGKTGYTTKNSDLLVLEYTQRIRQRLTVSASY